MRHAVILAGGSGTRLWPASRRARPKQLLAIGPSREVMLCAAIRRGRAVAGERVVVVTAEAQLAATHEVAPDLDAADLIGEPCGRNTAAAIGLAAATLLVRDPDAVMVVLPADQHVTDEAGLTRILEAGLGVVERDDRIGTIGITPTRAEIGFGYLEVDAAAGAELAVLAVKRFVEKPDHETAARYLASGRYLWNAGMFFVSARRLLAELDVHLPQTAHAVRQIAAAGPRAHEVAAALYPALASISIDHAVMERADQVFTIPASIGWDDIGSWAALPPILGADATGNTTQGTVVVLDGTGNLVLSDDLTMIAAIGVSDLVVVKSGDAILIMRKDQAQDVRKVVDALSARGLARYL